MGSGLGSVRFGEGSGGRRIIPSRRPVGRALPGVEPLQEPVEFPLDRPEAFLHRGRPGRGGRHPDATLERLKEMGGFDCTLVTLRRTLRRARWTRKKTNLHADERDRPDVKQSRRKFRRKARRLDAKRLVFLDETGVDSSMTPTHGWAPKGRRVEGSAPKSWSTLVSSIGLDGVRGSLAFPGAMNEPAFRTYVQDVPAPNLRPGDLAVMDDLRVHDSPAAEAGIERAGAREVRLPPFRPDCNPIEEMGSKIKLACVGPPPVRRRPCIKRSPTPSTTSRQEIYAAGSSIRAVRHPGVNRCILDGILASEFCFDVTGDREEGVHVERTLDGVGMMSEGECVRSCGTFAEWLGLLADNDGRIPDRSLS